MPDELAKAFGARLRTARRALGKSKGKGVRFTQADLAQALGVETNTVSRWEIGAAMPRQRAVRDRLAEVLEVSYEYLFGSEGGEEAAADTVELPPDVAKAARRLVDAFKREAAVAGATSEELHYIETVLMTPNLPPTLAGGAVPPEQLLEHIQAMMEPLRVLLRKLGRKL